MVGSKSMMTGVLELDTDLRASRPRRPYAGLPAYLEAKHCARVAHFALMMAVLSTMAAVLSPLVWGDQEEGLDLFPVWIVQMLAIGLSGALFLVARSGRFSHASILNLSLVYEVVFCLTVSLGYSGLAASARDVFPDITAVALVIAVYPLIVPTPPRQTLVAALASAATAPMSVWVLAVAGVVEPRPSDYLGVSLYPAISVVIATYGSRLIYRLNREVAKAQELGSYHLEKLLGKGGMGEVWRARHRLLARPAAVKLIRPHTPVGSDPGAGVRMLRRFEREAQVTASLTSPHTVDLFDFGRTDDGIFYYVMELLDGLDLHTLVDQYGPLPPERVVSILLQVCQSLAEAHEETLVHRDIKPGNIMVCRYGRQFDFVKVLDFGLVALAPEHRAGGADLTVEGHVRGTPAYMPPEMAEGTRLDGRADVYSLGCVAFWLLTGRLVFEAETPLSMILAHARNAPAAPSRFAEVDVPEVLDRIVLACLQKDPAQRPQTVDALVQMLAACPLEAQWTTARAQTWWETHRPATARRPGRPGPSVPLARGTTLQQLKP
jgi:serine/threonine-protein kinase